MSAYVPRTKQQRVQLRDASAVGSSNRVYTLKGCGHQTSRQPEIIEPRPVVVLRRLPREENMSRLHAATPLADMLEHEWQRQVVALAKQLGWTTYHTYNSRRSTHGFPDLVLVRDRVVYLELKSETGRVSAPQQEWLRKLRDAGGEVYVARPRDLQELANVLSTRTRGDGWGLE